MLSFERVTAENMPIIAGFLKYKISRTSDYTAGAMYMWRDFYNTSYAIYDNMIFFQVKFLNKTSFTYPVGSGSLTTVVAALREYCSSQNIPLLFCTVPLEAAKILEAEFQGANSCEPSRDWADYLYLASDLVELSGRRYSGQRNHINKFKKLFPSYEYHKITKDNLDQVIAYLEDYQRNFVKDSSLAVEEIARTLELMPFLEAFNLPSGFLEVDGTIIAMAIGEIVSDTLYVHVEKASRDYPGSYQMIVNEFAKNTVTENVMYINREEDVGDEGLRTSKLSYHPESLLDKYCVLIP